MIGMSPQEQFLATFRLKEYRRKIHVKHFVVQLTVVPLRNLGLFQTDLAEALKQETLLLYSLVGCLIVSKKTKTVGKFRQILKKNPKQQQKKTVMVAPLYKKDEN